MFSFRNIFKKDIVIYTAIFDGKDTLVEPEHMIKDADCVCFTDQDMDSKHFKLIKVENKNINPRLLARKFKVLTHKFLPEYKYSIWIDGNAKIKFSSAQELINEYLLSKKNKLATFIHPERDCIYSEAEVCIQQNKDSKEKIFDQIKLYKKENYPKHNGLVATGLIIKETNDESVKNIMEDWWIEISQKSLRDQLSFNYVTWKRNFHYNLINEFVFDNKLITIREHIKAN